jgi:uncharacterized membrane protein/predicted DsbA family dithiol-disulfide isomerase
MTHPASDPVSPAPADSAADGSIRPIPASILTGCVLSWLGSLICFLLLQEHTGLRALVCPVRGGCETVLSSPYAAFFGVPLSLLGAGLYLALLGMWLAAYAIGARAVRVRLLGAVLWITIIGVTFSAGLMYLQFGVLRAFCPLCTSSALVMVGLVAAASRAVRTVTTGDWGASATGAAMLALFAFFPAAILLGSGFTPRAEVQQFDLSLAQVTGPAGAPVQLVVFSDFECSFCRQFKPVLNRIRERYPREVLMAFRHYPIESHTRAFPAAVAAECAAEQGKFWEYHDLLFAEGGDLGDAKLLSLASGLGLDEARFSACLKSAAPAKKVEASRQDANLRRLDEVPAVFLNGVRVRGALNYEELIGQIGKLLPNVPGKTRPTN